MSGKCTFLFVALEYLWPCSGMVVVVKMMFDTCLCFVLDLSIRAQLFKTNDVVI